jgi:hypothetical protein
MISGSQCHYTAGFSQKRSGVGRNDLSILQSIFQVRATLRRESIPCEDPEH